jgi:hypothetical protein
MFHWRVRHQPSNSPKLLLEKSHLAENNELAGGARLIAAPGDSALQRLPKKWPLLDKRRVAGFGRPSHVPGDEKKGFYENINERDRVTEEAHG